jgi:hypothetical protein
MTNATGRHLGHIPMSIGYRRRSLAAMLVFAISIAACSASDEVSRTPAARESSVAISTPTEPVPDGDLHAWCFSWLDNTGFSDENGTEAALRAMLARVEAEAEVAPSAISEAMRAHLDATRYFVETMEAADWEEANLTPEDREVLAPDPNLDRAIDALDAYATENCDRTTSSDPPTPTIDLSSPTTAAPSVADVPPLLQAWPPRASAGELSDLEMPFPSDPALDDAVLCIEPLSAIDEDERYVQTFYDTERNAHLTIATTVTFAESGTTASPPTAAAAETVDMSDWTLPWQDASILENDPDLAELVLLGLPAGFVHLSGFGLTSEELIDIARTMHRRPAPEPGWDVPDLPAGMRPFAESGDAPAVGRRLVWIAGDDVIAELVLSTEDAEAVTAHWGAMATADSLANNDRGVIIESGQVITIAVPDVNGIEATLTYAGTRDEAVRIVDSIVALDSSTWNTVGRDGCAPMPMPMRPRLRP